MDYSIREYTKHPHEWKRALRTIQKEVDDQFSFPNGPIREEILSSYVLDFTTNDRYNWKKYWLETNGGQHEDCPDAAFEMLDKYWRSPEAKTVSEKMREKRSLVGKRARSASAPAGDRRNEVCSKILTLLV